MQNPDNRTELAQIAPPFHMTEGLRGEVACPECGEHPVMPDAYHTRDAFSGFMVMLWKRSTMKSLS